MTLKNFLEMHKKSLKMTLTFDDTKEKVLNPIQEEQVNEPVPHSSEKEDIKSQSSASTNSSSFLWPMPFASSQTIEVKPSQGFEFENVSILSNLLLRKRETIYFLR